MSTKNLLILIGMDRTCRVSSSFRERDCIWGTFCSHDFCRMFCCKSSTTKWLPTRIQKFKTYEISKCKCQGHWWFGCPNSWEGLVELLLWPKQLDCKTRTEEIVQNNNFWIWQLWQRRNWLPKLLGRTSGTVTVIHKNPVSIKNWMFSEFKI